MSERETYYRVLELQRSAHNIIRDRQTAESQLTVAINEMDKAVESGDGKVIDEARMRAHIHIDTILDLKISAKKILDEMDVLNKRLLK